MVYISFFNHFWYWVRFQFLITITVFGQFSTVINRDTFEKLYKVKKNYELKFVNQVTLGVWASFFFTFQKCAKLSWNL